MKHLLAALAALLLAAATPARAHHILWLTPLQPITRADGGAGGVTDYADLFQPDAPWQTVAAAIEVFKIYPALLRDAPDDLIRTLVADLRRRGIALALEGPGLTRSYACATRGRPGPNWIATLAERLKRLGGRLDYFVMDSPFVTGHVGAPDHDCPASIADVAADAAATAAALRRLFPDIRFGDIEVIGSGPGRPSAAQWATLGDWFDAFRDAAGARFAFLHMDVDWGQDWRTPLPAVAAIARARGLAFGALYSGSPAVTSDQAQADVTWEHIAAFETLLGGPPDHVVFQSWHDHPRRALPETDPTTMTGQVRAYLRAPTRLAAAGASVRLADESGRPLANAELLLQDEADAPETRALDGTVPHAARQALLALRVHHECLCATAAADFSLATAIFEQPGAPARDLGPTLAAWRATGAGESVTTTASLARWHVPAGLPLMRNGPWFPVTPDAPFSLRVGLQVAASAAGTGQLVLVFADAAGRELRRAALPLAPAWRTRQTLRTAADGTVRPPPTPPGATLRLLYPGDADHRPAILPLPR